MRLRLKVIVEAESGEVVATQQMVEPNHLAVAQWPDETEVVAVYRRIVAGPDQREHEVEVDVPESVIRTMDVDRLHAVAQEAVKKLGKPKRT
jgi:hypothetical protein